MWFLKRNAQTIAWNEYYTSIQQLKDLCDVDPWYKWIVYQSHSNNGCIKHSNTLKHIDKLISLLTYKWVHIE